MESQINNQKTGDWLMANNNQKSKASRTQSWRYLDKLVATQCYLQVRSFTVLHCRLFVHLRPWSLVAVPNLQFLQSLLCSRDLVSNGPNERHRLKEQFWIILEPCHYNFNSGIRAIGMTRVSKISKAETAWWLVSNSIKMQVAMTCQIKNRKSGAWSLPTTM